MRERERRDGRLRQAKALSPVVLLLISELFNKLDELPVKPKATVVLLVANIGLYMSNFSDAWFRQQHCLNASVMLSPRHPYSSLADFPFNRLLLSGFLHADDWHLYYNMSSLLWKGSQLEPRLGSPKFIALVAFSLVTAHLVYLAAALLLLNVFDYEDSYNSCAVGFSAVLFALKYVLNVSSPSFTNIHGMRVPLKHACWLELVLASLASSNISFVGHLSGILAGMLWVHMKLESLMF